MAITTSLKAAATSDSIFGSINIKDVLKSLIMIFIGTLLYVVIKAHANNGWPTWDQINTGLKDATYFGAAYLIKNFFSGTPGIPVSTPTDTQAPATVVTNQVSAVTTDPTLTPAQATKQINS